MKLRKCHDEWHASIIPNRIMRTDHLMNEIDMFLVDGIVYQ
jgi:hypothetical protein